MSIDLMSDMPFAPEPNQDIVRRLRQVDERLGLRYLPIGGGCWAITEKWGENDKRRERIRKGELAPKADFDVVGFADPDLTAEDAFAVLVKGLRAKIADGGDYQKMLEDTMYFNKARTEAVKNEAMSFGEELLDANQEKIAGKVISRGAGFSFDAEGKVVGTPHKPKMGLNKSERDARVEMSDK
jgi:hypothetical protein